MIHWNQNLSLLVVSLLIIHIFSNTQWKSQAIISTPDTPLLHGYLTIGDQQYQAMCTCRGQSGFPTKETSSSIQCNPQKIIILEDHGNEGISAETLRKLYAQPRDILLTPQESQMLFCMDDRLTRPVLLAPGGDLGEFLLGMFVFTGLTKTINSMSQDDIKSILSHFVATQENNRPFYHCNDEESVSHIEKSLDLIGLDLNSPQPQFIDSLLHQLTNPWNHGDFHLRSVLENPERYHLTKELATNTIHAFYSLLWDLGTDTSKQLYLEVLSGKRSPKAFVEIDEGESCHQTGRAPLMQPKKNRDGISSSVFMIHSGVITHRRQEMASFIFNLAKTRQINLGGITQQDIYTRLEKYGLEWLEATLSVIGTNLKFFKMTLQ